MSLQHFCNHYISKKNHLIMNAIVMFYITFMLAKVDFSPEKLQEQ